jgi:hypothetical protein
LVEGGKAAGKEAAKAAEGIIAKVAKDTLREADDVAKAAEKDAAKAAEGGAARNLPELRVDDAQFGKKVAKHARDFGLDPSDPAARDQVRGHIEDAHANPDEVRQGPWNPKGGGRADDLFYRKGPDVVVTKSDGTFVTVLSGGEDNGWYKAATVLRAPR